MVARGFVTALIFLIFSLSTDCRAEEPPLRLGLMPTNAVLNVLGLYHPLSKHLEQTLGRPVEMSVARSFRAFHDEVQAEDCDLVVPAPHFGVIALDHGYVPLFRYKPDLQALVVLNKAGGMTSPAQLRGKRVLTADRLTAVSIIAERWLDLDYGLRVGRDYELDEAANHTAAIHAVALGVADAAITTPPALTQVPPDIRDAVVALPSRLALPQMFLMAHRRLGAETVERVRAALASFPDTDDGKAFFAKGYGGLVPLAHADVEAARPYAEMVSRRIKGAP